MGDRRSIVEGRDAHSGRWIPNDRRQNLMREIREKGEGSDVEKRRGRGED